MAALSVQLLPVEGTRGSTAQPLPSVHHNGHQYIVAEAGLEFQVRVHIAKPSRGQHYTIDVSIDGQAVGYFMTTEDGYNFAATFEGWAHNAGDGRLHYRRFKFGECRPHDSAATVEHPDQISAGKIEVSCRAEELVGTHTPNSNVTSVHVDNTAASKKLPEGKTWFLQPGLMAEAGSMSCSASQWSNKVYRTLYSLPSLTVKYDTAENLKLRNTLKPSNPQHAAILRNSSNPRVAALLIDSRTANAGRCMASKPQAKEGVGKRGIKRERQQQGERDTDGGGQEETQIPPSATGEVVNLCDEGCPGPLKVNGRALKTDELAVCDLCDSDDEEAMGSWKIQKKPAITVK